MAEDVISIDYRFQEGTAFFHGSDVRVKTLFDYLEAGRTVEDFIKVHNDITVEMVNSVLESAEKLIEKNSESVNGMII